MSLLLSERNRIHLRFFLSLFIIFFLSGTFLLIALDSAHAKPSRAEYTYRQAKSEYDRLARSSRLRIHRTAWVRVIKRFRKVYLTYPNDKKVAPKALFMMARCYSELYGYSGARKDIREAIERYQVLVERFPKSRLADDALYALGDLYKRTGNIRLARKAWEKIVEEYPKRGKARSARNRLKILGPKQRQKTRSSRLTTHYEKEKGSAGLSSPRIAPGAKPATVQEVRHWSASDYTRVVIDTVVPVSFKKGYLPADWSKHLPERIYLDLKPARIGKKLKDNIPIQDGLLKGVRVAQFNRSTVRVVFDLGKTHKTKIFYLEDPFRVVVDAFGENYFQRAPCLPRSSKIPKKTKGELKDNGISLAQQLGLCVKRVVIDAGHGGKDPGAIGPTGLREKDVVLKIAKKVASRLKKELACQVVLTRKKDRFLPLTQRTAIANARKADIFVSIHANAAPNRRARGVETYFLNFALDEEAMRVAARENATSTKRIGDLKNILNDIMKNTKVDESSRLANYIQKEIVRNLRKRYSNVKSKGVKQAPFFVLIGARMPSVLVEVSFISNRKEEKRLKSNRYLDRVAEGIVNGIKSYISGTKLAYLPVTD
ncbi:MAG: N-acetylmuramoyl-L-alanine amidase [Deltaproteobacteria bacterium]|nr:N-acetylmuramoyl-L-alanine amidase [Deltaproteobacteria bacterium]